MKSARADADQVAGWIQDRYYWADVLTELHGVLIDVESKTGTTLHTPTGVWIEKFISAPGQIEDTTLGSSPFGGNGMTPIQETVPMHVQFDSMGRPVDVNGHPVRGSMRSDPQAPVPTADAPPPTDPSAPPATPGSRGASKASTNELANFKIVCRGVDVSATSGDPSSNIKIAYALEQALKGSPLFDSSETQLAGDNNSDPATGTFTFGVNLKLKRPLKL